MVLQTLFRSVFKPARLWPGGVVPYVVEPAVATDPDRMGILDYAFRTFRKFTCINFRPREPTDTNFLRFVDGGDMRCFSYVGMIGGDQILSLGRGCEIKTGITLHELSHALGLIHEHSRPDRDAFVTIRYQNIKPGKEGQFKKFSFDLVDVQNLPFDYSSIMMYRAHAFSKNDQPTIMTVDEKAQKTIGQRRGFSACDLEKLNKAYQCPPIPGVPSCNPSDTDPITTTTTTTTTTSTTITPSTTTTTITTTQSPTTTMDMECEDEREDLCKQAKAMPYRCLKYPGAFMLYCRKTCNNCQGKCMDAEPDRCSSLYKPYCDAHMFVQYKCPKTCGLCT